MEEAETTGILTEVNNIVLESKKDPKVDDWEKALIKDFALSVSVVLTELENLENEGKSIPNQDTLDLDHRNRFNQIFSSFLGIPTRFDTGAKLTSSSVDYFQKIWAMALDRVGEAIQNEQVKIGVKNWSLSGVGYPMGVAGTISVVFKGSEEKK